MKGLTAPRRECASERERENAEKRRCSLRNDSVARSIFLSRRFSQHAHHSLSFLRISTALSVPLLLLFLSPCASTVSTIFPCRFSFVFSARLWGGVCRSYLASFATNGSSRGEKRLNAVREWPHGTSLQARDRN